MSNVVFGDEGNENGHGIFGQGNAMMFSPGESEIPTARDENVNKVKIQVDIPDMNN